MGDDERRDLLARLLPRIHTFDRGELLQLVTAIRTIELDRMREFEELRIPLAGELLDVDELDDQVDVMDVLTVEDYDEFYLANYGGDA